MWWQVLIALCYTAGTRLNEAINLKWSDVDFEKDEIHVVAKRETATPQEWQPKDKDDRMIPIPKFTVDLLARLQATTEPGNPYVLISKDRLAVIRSAKDAGAWVENGQVVNDLRLRWLRIVSDAGIPHATIHDLRRSAITNWSKALPNKVTKELAGHSSIDTTDRYYLTITGEDMAKARDVTADFMLVDPVPTPNGPGGQNHDMQGQNKPR